MDQLCCIYNLKIKLTDGESYLEISHWLNSMLWFVFLLVEGERLANIYSTITKVWGESLMSSEMFYKLVEQFKSLKDTLKAVQFKFEVLTRNTN